MYELAAMLAWCADMNEWQRGVRGRGLQAPIWYTEAERSLVSFVLQRRGRGGAAAVLATGADIDIDQGGVLVNNGDLYFLLASFDEVVFPPE